MIKKVVPYEEESEARLRDVYGNIDRMEAADQPGYIAAAAARVLVDVGAAICYAILEVADAVKANKREGQ